MTTSVRTTHANYDLNNVSFSFSGPEDHTILTLSRSGAGAEEKLIIDPSQLKQEDRSAYTRLCVQRYMDNMDKHTARLNKWGQEIQAATELVSDCKQGLSQHYGISILYSAALATEENHDAPHVERSSVNKRHHERSYFDQFIERAISRIKGFFLES